jgi:hypothetical protein
MRTASDPGTMRVPFRRNPRLAEAYPPDQPAARRTSPIGSIGRQPRLRYSSSLTFTIVEEPHNKTDARTTLLDRQALRVAATTGGRAGRGGTRLRRAHTRRPGVDDGRGTSIPGATTDGKQGLLRHYRCRI